MPRRLFMKRMRSTIARNFLRYSMVKRPCRIRLWREDPVDVSYVERALYRSFTERGFCGSLLLRKHSGLEGALEDDILRKVYRQDCSVSWTSSRESFHGRAQEGAFFDKTGS